MRKTLSTITGYVCMFLAGKLQAEADKLESDAAIKRRGASHVASMAQMLLKLTVAPEPELKDDDADDAVH